MKSLHLLIKPSSGNCDLSCKYCFYSDVKNNRDISSYGYMKESTIEIVIKKALEYAEKECTFAFQGGEPTLIGLEFYKKVIEYQKKYNKKRLIINNCIQTNGFTIDEEWGKFLGENKFLVGISLDGNKEIHDMNRVDKRGNGTFNKVINATKIFNKYGVEYNILSVVTSQTSRNIVKIYNFYKKNEFKYLQFIPCIENFGEEKGKYPYSLTPSKYEEFLKKLFDIWYEDLVKGEYVYIRYFDNLLGIYLGYRPESCSLMESCISQNVIESDGGVYVCDFYAIDKYKIGNLVENSFGELDQNREKTKFIESSSYVNEECKVCNWYRICKGGCRRDREYTIDGELSLNYYCTSYKNFFAYAHKRFISLAQMKAMNPYVF